MNGVDFFNYIDNVVLDVKKISDSESELYSLNG